MLYKFAKVDWTIYNKDSKEVGHSDYLSTFKELENQLFLLLMWKKFHDCCIDVDVTLYPSSISEDTITILGAI